MKISAVKEYLKKVFGFLPNKRSRMSPTERVADDYFRCLKVLNKGGLRPTHIEFEGYKILHTDVGDFNLEHLSEEGKEFKEYASEIEPLITEHALQTEEIVSALLKILVEKWI